MATQPGANRAAGGAGVTAERIAGALDLKRMGRTWRGRCPLHGGSSFTITEKAGKVVFFCWSGCDRAEILRELRARGLWPERPRREWTPAERARYARAKRDARPLARLAAWWLQARMAELSDAKADATSGGRFDVWRLAPAASELHRLENLSADSVLREYLAAKAAEPERTKQLERVGRTWEQACEAAIRAVVSKLAREVGQDAA